MFGQSIFTGSTHTQMVWIDAFFIPTHMVYLKSKRDRFIKKMKCPSMGTV